MGKLIKKLVAVKRKDGKVGKAVRWVKDADAQQPKKAVAKVQASKPAAPAKKVAEPLTPPLGGTDPAWRKRAEEALSQGTFVGVKPPKDITLNHTRVMILEHEGQRFQAIAKTESASSRQSFGFARNVVDRETLGYEAGKLFDLPVMPTVSRKGLPTLFLPKSAIHSDPQSQPPDMLQLYDEKAIEHHKMDHYDLNNNVNRASIERIRAYDFVSGNPDRHEGNVLYRPNGMEFIAVPIDNEMCFGGKKVNVHEAVFPTSHMDGKLSDETKATIAAINPAQLRDTLRNGGLDEHSVKTALLRLALLQKKPEILTTDQNDESIYDHEDRLRKQNVLPANYLRQSDINKVDLLMLVKKK